MSKRYSKNTASITLDGVGRTASEVVADLNRLEAENAKLKKAVRKYLALISLLRRDVNAEYTALKILEALTKERSDG